MNGGKYMNYSKLIKFLKIWGKDIRTISFKYYGEHIECLVNNHYLLNIYE